ncbi:RNA-binding component of cleavage and polyadenylation factor [Polyrhizophydium stewartii]|uniref:mRNA 3'-end-processing protein n=1 Tax=Polyrhizophydium stewartii TaxID=2732419 RepID=A0ABR4NAK3_9FUNG|nr:hypothetical protein HK105_007236 [Polyrhizophydium stewartii]
MSAATLGPRGHGPRHGPVPVPHRMAPRPQAPRAPAQAATAPQTSAPPPTSIESVLHMDPGITFDFEEFVVGELGIALVRSQTREVCQYFMRDSCRQGSRCPYRHPANARAVVCKHWLRGLCKKGEVCEFLHEYNMKRMPECWFYAKLGECTNPECQYLHIDPASKIRECAWYARGFCKHGPACRHKHVRKAPCQNYLTGFCPKGAKCQFGHPRYEIPVIVSNEDMHGPGTAGAPQARVTVVYRNVPASGADPLLGRGSSPSGGGGGGGGGGGNQDSQRRALQSVTCYKCGELGHYANNCPKRRRQDEDTQPIPSYGSRSH